MSAPSIQSLYEESTKLQAQAAEAEAQLEAERAAHAATKKELAAARMREAKLRARLEQKGPVDSEDESWLMAHRCSIEFRRQLDRGEFVLLKGRGISTTRAKNLDAALEEAKKRARVTDRDRLGGEE